MDVSTLMKIVLSNASTNAISKSTGIPVAQITTILKTVMPMLLDGATAQANGQETASSFNKAIESHGASDTKDLARFLGNVDLADGAKIVQHLMGGNLIGAAAVAAKAANVTPADVLKIMAIVAPLLLSILGQQKKKHENNSSALVQAVLSGAAGKSISAGDVVGLIGGFLKDK